MINFAQNKILIVLACILLGYGLLKPDLSVINLPKPNPATNRVEVTSPKDSKVLEACKEVIQSLKKGSTSRKIDGPRLASLYYDLATLIELDDQDQVIKDTLAIRESNKLAGALSRLGLGGKYPDLAEACNGVVVAGIGDEDIVLDKETRKKAVDTFKALSWACLEGSK